MEQLQKKRTQIQLTTWLAKPGALSLSQHRAERQAPRIPASGPMKEPPAKSSMGTEPQLLLSALTSPCFPSADWMARPKLPAVSQAWLLQNLTSLESTGK